MTSPRIQEIRHIATEDRDLALGMWSEAWDTRDTALRALIAHWREKAERDTAIGEQAREAGFAEGEILICTTSARELNWCADQLAALLED